LDVVAVCGAVRAKAIGSADLAPPTPSTPGNSRRYGAWAFSAATLAAAMQGAEAWTPASAPLEALPSARHYQRPMPITPNVPQAEKPMAHTPRTGGAVPLAARRGEAADLPLTEEIVDAARATEAKPRAAGKRRKKSCPFGKECIHPRCQKRHPAAKKQMRPWKKNAQVVVLREMEDGEWSVLLQRRGLDAAMGAGKLATIGGRREETDRDSFDTAVREVFEETGLLDLGHLPGAPPELRAMALARRAKSPLEFRLFTRGKFSDWWILVLDGGGTYIPAPHRSKCADVTDVTDMVEGAAVAPAFGHVWVPVSSAVRITPWDSIDGLVVRIRQAVFSLHCDEAAADRG